VKRKSKGVNQHFGGGLGRGKQKLDKGSRGGENARKDVFGLGGRKSGALNGAAFTWGTARTARATKKLWPVGV